MNSGVAAIIAMASSMGWDLDTKAFDNSVFGSSNGRRGTPCPASSAKIVGRNELCPCGSGIKFKKCCLRRKKNED